MDVKVLTAAEVAEKRKWIEYYPQSTAKVKALALCDSHELLRAENTRVWDLESALQASQQEAERLRKGFDFAIRALGASGNF